MIVYYRKVGKSEMNQKNTCTVCIKRVAQQVSLFSGPGCIDRDFLFYACSFFFDSLDIIDDIDDFSILFSRNCVDMINLLNYM